MKSKIILVTLAVVLAAALVGGATMAWFTDQETNAANTFTAGTLNIELQDAKFKPFEAPIFKFENIAPGWESGTVTVNLANTGTLPVIVRGVVSGTTNGAPGDALYAALDGRYRIGGVGTWSGWYSAPALPVERFLLTPVPVGVTVPVELQFKLPNDTGNAAQGGIVTLNLTVTATQTANPGWAE